MTSPAEEIRRQLEESARVKQSFSNELIDRIAQFAAADAAGFHAILAVREGKLKTREVNVEGTMNQYFAFVEAVTDEFDRRIEAKR